ncbi:MAG: cytidine deaminase [Reinekea sp.]|jgi:cytidine deaminase
MSEFTEKLHQLAIDAAAKAYAPYSDFPVGAALVTKDGQLIQGCNVENASYNLGLCAERNAITSAATQGARPGDINELVLFVNREPFTSPCGGCRQVISEFMDKGASVIAYNSKGEAKHWTVEQLLPDGFSGSDL